MEILKIALLGFAVIASAAFSADLTKLDGKYQGGGKWATNDGQHGVWTTALTVAKEERGYAVEETLKVWAPGTKPSADAKPMHEETGKWRAVGVGNGFFDVVVDGEKTGWGFCEGFSCQMHGTKGKDINYGETFLIGEKGIYRVGYDKKPDVTVSWSGGIVKK